MSKTATIKGPNFEQVINLPETLKQVTLNNYVAFLNEAQKPGNQITQLALAVAEFYGIATDVAMQMQVSDIQSLFRYAVNVISAFVPETKTEDNFSFEYQQQYFTIPRMLPPILAGGEEIPPTMQVIEAVEIQETIRLNKQETDRLFAAFKDGADELKDVKPEDYETIGKAFDRRRDLSFSQYLRLIAILTRRDNEPLPVSDSDREAWITTRAIFFRDIDAATALDVDFFLRGTLMLCRKTLQTGGFLSLQTFALLAAMQPQSEQKQKRTKGQPRTGKRYSSGRGSKRLSRALLKADGLRGKKKHP